MELIFVPFHDFHDFIQTGFMTREYYILYLIKEHFNVTKCIIVNKPRTILTWRFYSSSNIPKLFPSGTIPQKILSWLRINCILINYNRLFSPKEIVSQMIKKRGWWVKAYARVLEHNINTFRPEDVNKFVYSNNPFAIKLILGLKRLGFKIIFDAMDNFAIHPSLTENERKEALEAYSIIVQKSDFLSANSTQTCDFFEKNFGRRPILIKNGVLREEFLIGNVNLATELKKIVRIIENAKRKYKLVAGYIGKLGFRIDERLVEYIASKRTNYALIFIGPFLRGQYKKLRKVFRKHKNVYHISGIASAYLPLILKLFDTLIIPHAVGDRENGGDPLKLYQYMVTGKPVITTPILGVEEFKNYIYICQDYKTWIKVLDEISENKQEVQNYIKIYTGDSYPFEWSNRLKPMLDFISDSLISPEVRENDKF